MLEKVKLSDLRRARTAIRLPDPQLQLIAYRLLWAQAQGIGTGQDLEVEQQALQLLRSALPQPMHGTLPTPPFLSA